MVVQWHYSNVEQCIIINISVNVQISFIYLCIYFLNESAGISDDL